MSVFSGTLRAAKPEATFLSFPPSDAQQLKLLFGPEQLYMELIYTII